MSYGQTRRAPLAWLTELFRELFTSTPKLLPGRYAAYNALIGGILLLIGAVMLSGPARSSFAVAIVLVSVGVLLEIGIVLVFLGIELPRAVLLLSGLLITALTVAASASSVDWALRAPPKSGFRYAPALSLVLGVYGMLQVAASRPDTARARAIKMCGLYLGLLCELAVFVSLLVRATR
jgi:hypothetical protein